MPCNRNKLLKLTMPQVRKSDIYLKSFMYCVLYYYHFFNMIVFPVLADSRAASSIFTTITLLSKA